MAPEQPVRNDRGFTLLEVLVAFIIAAFALAALFSGGLGGLQAAAVSGRTTEALSRAQSHLAAAPTGDALAAGDRQGDEGGGFHWRVRIVTADTALPDPSAQRGAPVLALYAVSSAVSWTEGGRTRSVQLDSLRTAPAPPPPP